MTIDPLAVGCSSGLHGLVFFRSAEISGRSGDPGNAFLIGFCKSRGCETAASQHYVGYRPWFDQHDPELPQMV